MAAGGGAAAHGSRRAGSREVAAAVRTRHVTGTPGSGRASTTAGSAHGTEGAGALDGGCQDELLAEDREGWGWRGGARQRSNGEAVRRRCKAERDGERDRCKGRERIQKEAPGGGERDGKERKIKIEEKKEGNKWEEVEK